MHVSNETSPQTTFDLWKLVSNSLHSNENNLFFVNNWVIRENERYLLAEPCFRATCCVEIKLEYFFRNYIFICTIYTLVM